MPLNTAFLKKLSYRDGEGEIEAEFEGNNSIEKREFPFSPEIRLPQNKAVTALAKEIVSPHARLVFSEGKGKSAFRSKSISVLKEAHALLSLSLKAIIPLLEPERQFLLSRNWKYFDKFRLEKGRVEKPEDSQGIPELPDGIPLKKALLSRALCVPLEALPERKQAAGRILVENAAFKESQLMFAESEAPERHSWTNHIFSGFVELDFSRAVLEKIIELNLGFESMNCSCCAPRSLNSKNVLPNSMVEAEFSENGYYFESLLPSFSQEFHKSSGNKEARIGRKGEFYLEHYPVGPFYAGNKAMVPLADARKLEAERSATITGDREELKWSCQRRRSFLAGEIERLLSAENSARQKMLFLEKDELRRNGLNAFNPCFEGKERLALKECAEANSFLAEALFSAVASDCSPFRHSELFRAIEAFKSEILSSCNTGLERKNAERIYLNAGRAFIRSREAFTELALVSREIGVPAPIPC